VRLERIKRLQADGHTLLEIGRILIVPSAKSAMDLPTAWWQHAIADDVIVGLKDGASPWRTKQPRAALEEFAHRARPEKKTKSETAIQRCSELHLDHGLNAAIGTALIENGQCGESRASRHLLSADYKDAALSASTGALRAQVARQEEVECNTSVRISLARFVI
jgi:hypothetical protein